MTDFTNPAQGATTRSSAYVENLLALLGDRDPLTVLPVLADEVAALVAGMSEAQVRQPEKEGKWSVIQVVQHLADIEIVYGYRFRLILAQPEPTIQGFDQDAWAERLRYSDAKLDEAMEQLRVLRGVNVRLYRSLDGKQLDRVGLHSERGPESVRHILRLVAAHDLVHRRQIERIKRAIGA
ncbi:MAG TPA: DinB family protein [Thermoanaerobaculia bacterium]